MEKVILIIRDGWGYRKSKTDNAISSAKTPFTDHLMKAYPNSLLDASGEAVGLPKNFQGNSEVGHMAIGSGRIIDQSLTAINRSITNKSFFKNKALISAIDNCKKHDSNLHITELLQTEGVHSHREHLFAILDLCKKKKINKVYIHVITDGRDAPVKDSLKHIRKLKQKIKEIEIGTIATVSGRYYAMDRNKRWERTKQAYEAIANGESKIKFNNVIDTINLSHKKRITDEFIIPRVRDGYIGFEKNDSFIFCNFRTDRTRQLMKAVCEKKFSPWKRDQKKIFPVAMTKYYDKMNARVAFDTPEIKNRLGEIVAKNNLKQLRISETEKYAHVTFFFNGQIEKKNNKEDRILIPSPNIATYDLKPEMSVFKIANTISKEIKKEKYNLIVTNLVNGDMVGHTGKVPAIKKAVQSVDKALEKIVDTGLRNNYKILILADHGNAEDQSPRWRTSHTTNKVPCILVSKDKVKLKNGGLRDIAPTVLDLMKIKKPREMTGTSLIKQ